jgi:hypothetical protein
MKLELGKFYYNELSQMVQIVAYRQFLFIRRYFDSEGRRYTRAGKHVRYRKSLYSLSHEVVGAKSLG